MSKQCQVGTPSNTLKLLIKCLFLTVKVIFTIVLVLCAQHGTLTLF